MHELPLSLLSSLQVIWPLWFGQDWNDCERRLGKSGVFLLIDPRACQLCCRRHAALVLESQSGIVLHFCGHTGYAQTAYIYFWFIFILLHIISDVYLEDSMHGSCKVQRIYLLRYFFVRHACWRRSRNLRAKYFIWAILDAVRFFCGSTSSNVSWLIIKYINKPSKIVWGSI